MLQSVMSRTQIFDNFVEMVRQYMRDMPHLNRLVAGEESSKMQISMAVMTAVDEFNGTPPFTQYSIEGLLAKGQSSLLLKMVVIEILESVVVLQMRNQINYSAGGLNVGVNDKAPLLMNFIQYLKASTDQRKQHVKIAMNIESILTPMNVGVRSEYWFVNGLFAV